MNGRIKAIIIALLMLSSFIVLIVEVTPVVKSSDIIYVDDEPGVGPGNPAENYTNIQEAIDAAKDGDTVYVYSGKYLENVEVNKTINLTGENRDNTTIDGNGGDVIQVTTDWVNVSGFTVMNGHHGIWLHRGFQNIQGCRIFNNTAYTNNQAGIGLTDSSDNWIAGNNVSNNDVGIDIHALFNDADNNILIDNNVSSCNVGFWLWGSCWNTLVGNSMVNNGIWIDGWMLEHWNTHNIDTSNTVNGKPVQYWKNQNGGEVPVGGGQVILANCTDVRVEGQEPPHGTVGIVLGFSSNNNIIGNNVSSNNYYCIYLYGSNGNIITGNNASSNNAGGIHLRSSNGNSIIGNNVSLNYLGIYLGFSSGNNIIGNTVSNNVFGFDFYYDSNNNDTSDNLIYHNIMDNPGQAIDETNNSNQWDNGYPSGGNYWSDFDEPSEDAYDDYQGINQDDATSGDGIVDNGTVGGGGKNPYIIDDDSQDNYPLLYFYESPFLFPGWNLISVPLIQSDTNLGAVLSSINNSYNSVWAYNISDSYDHWKHYHTSMPAKMNDLGNIDHTMGFWIYITEPGGVLFNYSGTQPTENQTIELYTGWNLVGYPSKSNKLRDDALGDLTFGDDIYKIKWYNAPLGRIEEVTVKDHLKIGQGYWVYANRNCVWEVPL
jgi:parallel beta-helix repeat protein